MKTHLLLLIALLSFKNLCAYTGKVPFGFKPTTEFRQISFPDDPVKSIKKRISIGKTLTYVGIGVTASGPVFMAAGLLIFASGLINSYSPALMFGGLALFYWGIINVAVGIPLVVAGAVLWGTGKKKLKRAEFDNVELRGFLRLPGQVGLALRF